MDTYNIVCAIFNDFHDLVSLPVTFADIDAIATEAESIIGFSVVYDEVLFQSLNLKEFKKFHYAGNDLLLQAQSLDKIIEDKLLQLRPKLTPSLQYVQCLSGAPNFSNLHDLLQNGQRAFMLPDFIPNGYHKVQLSRSYKDMSPICNHVLLKDVREGRAICFSKQALVHHGCLDQLHGNKIAWAEKANKVEGRTCLNCSSRSLCIRDSDKRFSLNDCVDFSQHDSLYPEYELPFMPDIAEMACTQRDRYPGERLWGATIDVASAYKRTPQSVASAKLFTVPIEVMGSAGSPIILIVIYLVGVFGFTRSGHVYCLCAAAINYFHNLGQPSKRSETYIDDGLLIDPGRLIRQSVDSYTSCITVMFGQDGIQPDKNTVTDGYLEGIGWHFCFVTWTVRPKVKGIAKMLVFLFRKIPIGRKSVHHKVLDATLGILNWYADGLPSGKSHLSALYGCLHGKDKAGMCFLTPNAQYDLNWWRSLAVVAYKRPPIVASSIDHVRRRLSAEIFLRTDASSLIGGGAYMTSNYDDPLEMSLAAGSIRWIKEELKIFVDLGISINILEYFTAVYFVMLWVDTLRGKIILIESDNTSAVSWLMKKRSTRNPHADLLARVFNLFCLSEHICVISRHIAGNDNSVADDLSRKYDLITQEEDEELIRGLKSNGSQRPGYLRQLLLNCIKRACSWHTQPEVNELILLRGLLGRDFAS